MIVNMDRAMKKMANELNGIIEELQKVYGSSFAKIRSGNYEGAFSEINEVLGRVDEFLGDRRYSFQARSFDSNEGSILEEVPFAFWDGVGAVVSRQMYSLRLSFDGSENNLDRAETLFEETVGMLPNNSLGVVILKAQRGLVDVARAEASGEVKMYDSAVLFYESSLRRIGIVDDCFSSLRDDGWKAELKRQKGWIVGFASDALREQGKLYVEKGNSSFALESFQKSKTYNDLALELVTETGDLPGQVLRNRVAGELLWQQAIVVEGQEGKLEYLSLAKDSFGFAWDAYKAQGDQVNEVSGVFLAIAEAEAMAYGAVNLGDSSEKSVVMKKSAQNAMEFVLENSGVVPSQYWIVHASRERLLPIAENLKLIGDDSFVDRVNGLYELNGSDYNG